MERKQQIRLQLPCWFRVKYVLSERMEDDLCEMKK